MTHHRVQTVTLDLDMTPGMATDAVLDDVSSNLERVLAPLLDQALQAVQTGRIERLELDLGRLSRKRLSQDLPRAIERALARALQGVTPAPPDPTPDLHRWLSEGQTDRPPSEIIRQASPTLLRDHVAVTQARQRIAALPDAAFDAVLTRLDASAAFRTCLSRIEALPWDRPVIQRVRSAALQVLAAPDASVASLVTAVATWTGASRDTLLDRMADMQDGGDGLDLVAPTSGWPDLQLKLAGNPVGHRLTTALVLLDPMIETRWGFRQKRLADQAQNVLRTQAFADDLPALIVALASALTAPPAAKDGLSAREATPFPNGVPTAPADIWEIFRDLMQAPVKLQEAIWQVPWHMHEHVLEQAAPGHAGLLLSALRASEPPHAPADVHRVLWRLLYPLVAEPPARRSAAELLLHWVALAAAELGQRRADIARTLRNGAAAQSDAADAARFGPLLSMLPDPPRDQISSDNPDTGKPDTGKPDTGKSDPDKPDPGKADLASDQIPPPLSPHAAHQIYGPAAPLAHRLRHGPPDQSTWGALAGQTAALAKTDAGRLAIGHALPSSVGRAALARLEPKGARHRALVPVLGAATLTELEDIGRLLETETASAPPDSTPLLPIHGALGIILEHTLRAVSAKWPTPVIHALRQIANTRGIALPTLLAILRSRASGPLAHKLEEMTRKAWQQEPVATHTPGPASSFARPKPTPPDPHQTSTIHTPIAGAVLLWPFLPTYLQRLGTLRGLQDEALRAEGAARIGALLTGGPQPEDSHLALLKTLMHLPQARPAPRPPQNGDADALGQDMLRAVLVAWPRLEGTSPGGLIDSFLRRPGLLYPEEEATRLRVEKRPFDMLLDLCPWSLSPIRLSWMTKPLFVEWR